MGSLWFQDKSRKGFIKLEIQGDSLVLFQEDNFGNWKKDETVPIKPTKVGPKGIEFSKTFYNDVDTTRTIHKIEFTDFKRILPLSHIQLQQNHQ